MINDTSATLDVPIVYDDGSSPTKTYWVRGLSITGGLTATGLLPGGRDTGILLDWPILRVAVCNLDNPYLPIVQANYYDTSKTLIRSVGVPFGHPALQAGVDFSSGDTVIFHFTEDSRSSAFVRVSIGLISGASQGGDFSRGNPFDRLEALLQTTGF